MSGSNVAYHLRVNKYIDRQVFIESLGVVNRFSSISKYAYVSMAGSHLEDCRVIHQSLRVSRMYSFDTSSSVVRRQKVNKPYGFVKINKQSSVDVVQDWAGVRESLGGVDTNVIVWLDYAAPKHRRSQLEEVMNLTGKLIDGDVLRVTINSNRSTLGEKSVHDRLVNIGDPSVPASLDDWRFAFLKEQIGDYLPAGHNGSFCLASKSEFNRTLVGAVKQAVLLGLQSRPELIAFPLLSTAYSDCHDMITVACIILKDDRKQHFVDVTRWDSDWPYKPGGSWDDLLVIDVPFLSLRERSVLHSRLQAKKNGGFKKTRGVNFLEDDEIAQYLMHYHRYPSFAAMDIL